MAEYVIHLFRLPPETTEADLKTLFVDFWNKFTRVAITNPRDPTKMHRKIGFIHTLDKFVFDEMLSLDGISLHNTPISIEMGRQQISESCSSFKHAYSLRVSNIPTVTKKEDLKLMFDKCGPIFNITIHNAFCIAYVDFLKHESMLKALQLPSEERTIHTKQVFLSISRTTLNKLRLEQEAAAMLANKSENSDPCFSYPSTNSESELIDFCSPASRLRYLEKLYETTESYLKKTDYKCGSIIHSKPNLFQMLKQKSREKQMESENQLARRYDYITCKLPNDNEESTKISFEELQDLEEDLEVDRHTEEIPLAIRAKDIYKADDSNHRRRVDNVFNFVRDSDISGDELFNYELDLVTSSFDSNFDDSSGSC